jgi:hypothetical protein
MDWETEPVEVWTLYVGSESVSAKKTPIRGRISMCSSLGLSPSSCLGTLRHLRWKQYVPSKIWTLYELHGVSTQNATIMPCTSTKPMVWRKIHRLHLQSGRKIKRNNRRKQVTRKRRKPRLQCIVHNYCFVYKYNIHQIQNATTTKKLKLNSMAWVRKRTIPTDWATAACRRS